VRSERGRENRGTAGIGGAEEVVWLISAPLAASRAARSRKRLTQSRSRHRHRIDELVELFRRQVSERYARLFERNVLLNRLLGDRRRFVVADVRVQRGNEHRRTGYIAIELSLVRRDARSLRIVLDTMLAERPASVGEQSHRVQKIMNNHGL